MTENNDKYMVITGPYKTTDIFKPINRIYQPISGEYTLVNGDIGIVAPYTTPPVISTEMARMSKAIF
jgi:hypothetical protein